MSVITEKQFDFIKSLTMERIDISDEVKDRALIRAGGLNKSEASAAIERLLAAKEADPLLVRSAKPKGGQFEEIVVPAAHYAVDGEDGTTDFYNVWRPKDTGDSGTFALYLQLGPDDFGQRIKGKAAITILKRIEADGPKAAAIRYGNELGHCSRCNRELTNPDSIEAGIGPVCSKAFDR